MDSKDLRNLKTIKQAQESFENGFSGDFGKGFDALDSMSSLAKQNALKSQVSQTQKILNNEPLDSVESSLESSEMPTLRRAKTIKESMQDWLDDEKTNDMPNLQNLDSKTATPKPQTTPQTPQNLATQATQNLTQKTPQNLTPQTPQTPQNLTPNATQNKAQNTIQAATTSHLTGNATASLTGDATNFPPPLHNNISGGQGGGLHNDGGVHNDRGTQKTDSITPQNLEAQKPKPPQKTLPQEITQGLQEIKNKPQDSDIAELKQDKYDQIVKAQSTKQETWILLDEFLRLSGLEKPKVLELINDKSIKSKTQGDKIYIEASTGTSALIKKVENRLVSLDMSGNALDPVFVEKTIATILGLHEKVVSAKDESISAFKSENSFLKEALVSMQEIYDDDKKTIEILRQQLQKAQEEVEFVKRKYKLMWGRVSNSAT